MILIFDCDGVIFQSNQLKNHAFESVLAAHGFADAVIAEFLTFHKRNGGVSRYAKFDYLLTELSPVAEPAQVREALLLAFGRACREGYQNVPMTDQAASVIERLAARHEMFVASGSDEAELRDVFQDRRLDQFFQKIYGSPRKKSDVIADILAHRDGRAEALMIGDSVKDYEAAADNGVPTVLMPTYSDDPDGVRALTAEKGLLQIEHLDGLFGLGLDL